MILEHVDGVQVQTLSPSEKASRSKSEKELEGIESE